MLDWGDLVATRHMGEYRQWWIKLSVELELIKASGEWNVRNRPAHSRERRSEGWDKVTPEVSGSDSRGLQWELKLLTPVHRFVQCSMNSFPGHGREHLCLPKEWFSLQEASCSNSQDFPQCQLSSRHFSVCQAPLLSVKEIRIWSQ